ncbi:hypothetical protein AQUCO_00900982v1 [Aquilegia coerulea]|uniref:Delta(14)-sterol reductase n=1 Tax=Aquilegia coerulea TaxID=218851 RepID=A0A2G5EG81_AQUCA|nr:hypothetical protein AQUCO_00900982v1 [Aquilegia coerulea]
MEIDLFLLHSLIPSWTSVVLLVSFFTYLGISGSLLPGKIVHGATLPDGTRLHYRCNGLHSLLLLITILGIGVEVKLISPTVIADRGLELLSATFGFSVLVTLALYIAGHQSSARGSSLKPHVSGNLIHDWWFGIQLNPHFIGLDLKFFFVRAGMMGWLFINLSVLAKSIQDGSIGLPMILYQMFCVFYIVDYFYHEEYMTSTWDIIAERLGFMLVFGDLVWIPFAFSIQGWWLLSNKVELTKAAAIANCIVFLYGNHPGIESFEELTSKSTYSKRTLKPLYGVSHQKLLAANCLLLVIGGWQDTAITLVTYWLQYPSVYLAGSVLQFHTSIQCTSSFF